MSATQRSVARRDRVVAAGGLRVTVDLSAQACEAAAWLSANGPGLPSRTAAINAALVFMADHFQRAAQRAARRQAD